MSSADARASEFPGHVEGVAAVNPEIKYQISFSDGGYNWRMEIGKAFGDWHGPFPTEDEARADAVAYIDKQLAKFTLVARKVLKR